MWYKISIPFVICSFVLCIPDSDGIDLQQNDIQQIFGDGYKKKNITRFDRIITCCCASTADLTHYNLIVHHPYRIRDETNCEDIPDLRRCVCYFRDNDSTRNEEENKTRNCSNNTAIYVSVGAAASILFLTLIICLLLIRKKRTGLLIERLSERRQSNNNQNAITAKSYTENHEEKLNNKGLNHDPIRRNNYIVKERETSNIYHSLDNLHITPERESSSQRIHKRGPHPLPNYNNREDHSFHFKMSSAVSSMRRTPQRQPILQKTEIDRAIVTVHISKNASVASELNHLFHSRLLNENSNTYEMDKKFDADGLRLKSNSSTVIPKVLPILKPKPALPINKHLEDMRRAPHFQPLLKFKKDTALVSTLKPRAPSPPQSIVPPMRLSSEYEDDDDDWNYEQLPPINI